MGDEPMDPRFAAGIDMLRRTGLTEFQIRHSPDDEKPTVWIAVGKWPTPGRTPPVWETASSLNPLGAVMRLCELVIDGGVCVHCGKVASFSPVHTSAPLAPGLVCDTQWDPELATFRRGCE